MQLLMYLGKDLIESVTVNLNRLSEPGYLSNIKRTLTSKHEDRIRKEIHELEFLLNSPMEQAGRGMQKKVI